VRHASSKRSLHRRRRGEVHVSHPQRLDRIGAEQLAAQRVLLAVRAAAVDRRIKVETQRMRSQRLASAIVC
jgi:hypothetical protein